MRFVPSLPLAVFLTATLLAQQPVKATQPLEVSRANFTDVTSALGVRFQYMASHTPKHYLLETMGAGVALFDYDNDDRLDIFLVNGAPLPDPTPKGTIPQKTGSDYWNRLYHQKQDGTFEDVTEKAGLQGTGYGMGVAVGDYDNDGYEDLYVTAYGGNKLYHNNGDGTFTDVTEQAGVGGSGWSTTAAWVDLDGDGRLDLIVLRYIVLRYLQWTSMTSGAENIKKVTGPTATLTISSQFLHSCTTMTGTVISQRSRRRWASTNRGKDSGWRWPTTIVTATSTFL
jgi:hypothetical protein